jgi:phosphoglycerate dehydrogenase-like enzyme
LFADARDGELDRRQGVGTRVEPLAGGSVLWTMRNVLITPHTAGETQRYEDGVIDLLLANLERPLRGEAKLVNQVV